MRNIVIAGFSTQKRPGFFGLTTYGSGPISLASIPLILLLVGLKSSSGSITPDAGPVSVQTQDQIDTQAGPGAELARMGYTALLYSNVTLMLACPTASGGAAAATATITFTGTVSAGTWIYRIGGVQVSGSFTAADTLTTIAAAVAAAVNANTQMPVTATAAIGVVTLTHKCPGIRGNQLLLAQDKSQIGSGVSSAIAGGSALTGGIVPFHSGSGTEDVTALLASLYPGRYHRVVIAQNDATNLGLWRAQSDSKAGPDQGRMEHYGFASNGTLASAATLATGVNEERMSIVWSLNNETHPSEMAASYMALRVVAEQSQPNSSYDGQTLLGVAPQSQSADWPTTATQEAALAEGVTPLLTTADGNVTVCRAISTHSLNGSNPDYRTFDVADAVVPDYVRDFDRLEWETEFSVANPFVRDDAAAGSPEPPRKVATPTRWARQLATNGFALETALILTNTTAFPPVADYDATNKRILSIHPAPRLPHQHQIGESVLGLTG